MRGVRDRARHERRRAGEEPDAGALVFHLGSEAPFGEFSAFLARTLELGESAGMQIKVSVVALEAVEPKLDCQEAPAGAVPTGHD